MNSPRARKPKLSPEHLLLLGALVVFLVGAAWVVRRPAAAVAANTRSWIGALPSPGLPLLHTLFRH